MPGLIEKLQKALVFIEYLCAMQWRMILRVAWSVFTLALGSVLPMQVRAWDGHFYLGLGLGLQQNQAPLSRFPTAAIPCFTKANNTIRLECRNDTQEQSFAPSVFAGAQFNEYLAVETGYANLPDSYNVRVVNPDFPAPTFVSVEQDSAAFFLRGVVSLPLSKLSSHPWLAPVSISTVAGLTRWRSNAELVADVSGAIPGQAASRARADQVGRSLTFGARVNYAVSEQIRLSLSWDRFRALGKNPVAALGIGLPPTVGTVKADVDVFAIGASYLFR